jgi:SAM-dependent methyltransferase
MNKPELLADVADYYSSKLAAHGDTPRGVDWNGEESQVLRFAQLARVIAPGAPFSINDVGCGYGALLDYLQSGFPDLTYTGCDISADMIAAAHSRHAASGRVQFVTGSEPPAVADYSVASGIFNVRLGHTDAEWRDCMAATIYALDQSSTHGFAFNCLSSYSDADRMRDYLYYADPCALFDLCKRRYSRDVALLHDYGLYEFTLLVRKAR